VLALRDKTLMNRAGEQGDALPAHLIAKVLTGDANTGGAGWFEDIDEKRRRTSTQFVASNTYSWN